VSMRMGLDWMKVDLNDQGIMDVVSGASHS